MMGFCCGGGGVGLHENPCMIQREVLRLSKSSSSEVSDIEALVDSISTYLMVCDGNTDCAAIASELAASHYGMEVLESNIEDDDSNFTRFLLLSRQSIR